MPDVGEHVRVHSRKVGEAPREGVVTGVIGVWATVEWSYRTRHLESPNLSGRAALLGG
jgi:hypothetical protein